MIFTASQIRGNFKLTFTVHPTAECAVRDLSVGKSFAHHALYLDTYLQMRNSQISYFKRLGEGRLKD